MLRESNRCSCVSWHQRSPSLTRSLGLHEEMFLPFLLEFALFWLDRCWRSSQHVFVLCAKRGKGFTLPRCRGRKIRIRTFLKSLKMWVLIGTYQKDPGGIEVLKFDQKVDHLAPWTHTSVPHLAATLRCTGGPSLMVGTSSIPEISVQHKRAPHGTLSGMVFRSRKRPTLPLEYGSLRWCRPRTHHRPSRWVRWRSN